MKKKLIVGLLIVNCFNLKGQIDTTKQQLVYGVSLTAILSSYSYQGASPSLTVNYLSHQLSIGSRIPFIKGGGNSGFKSNQLIFVTDFQYRYYFLQHLTIIHPFGFASIEYGFERYHRDLFYDHTKPHYYGPLLDYSFDYRLHYREHQLNLYFGLGVEAPIWNGFYCFLSSGAGTGHSWGHERWVESNSGVTQYSDRLNFRFLNGFNWIASGGVGFRYHPKQTKKERQDYRKQKRIELSSL